MMSIKVEIPGRPGHFKTYNHRLASRANKHWSALLDKGLTLFAVDNGNVIMKHENGVSYRATGEMKFHV